MSIFKKISTIIVAVFLILIVIKPTNAQEKHVNVYLFWGDGCPHCAKEKEFLQALDESNPEVNVYYFEIYYSSENRKYLQEVQKTLGTDSNGVPYSVVGDQSFVGFSPTITTEEIKNRIIYCYQNDCPDSVASIVGIVPRVDEPVPTKIPEDDNGENDHDGSIDLSQKQDDQNEADTGSDADDKENIIPEKIVFPVIGEIQTKNLSLPVFTIVLGVLDGFNPCAMWTLLFLISLLLGMENKRRRWILGTAFIIASAFVYFLFMAAWLNLIIFVGFVVWVRILIGLVAIGGGGYNLREYFTNKEAACKVTGSEKRQKVFEKLKNITHQKKFIIALGGIILLAFAVNLVELICSAGLPVVFTQVLALSELSRVTYYGYMLMYIFFFMIDDLFVFFTAMITLEMTGISTKYSRVSNLVGGVLMLTIGLLLIFKPEVLMFG
ncbi:hypothetical protein JXA63_01120 [Candidatus Woesebacteria bacterium]|nr:hypothetical protein [Candidatus Woesebacteria bacterium]